MAAVQPIRQQSYEAIYALLRTAMLSKKPVSAVYKDHRRVLCPHVLGRTKDGRLQVLCYQTGGQSSSGLGPRGSDENWRCVALEKLSSVEIADGSWQSPTSQTRPQSCVATVELEVAFTRSAGRG